MKKNLIKIYFVKTLLLSCLIHLPCLKATQKINPNGETYKATCPIKDRTTQKINSNGETYKATCPIKDRATKKIKKKKTKGRVKISHIRGFPEFTQEVELLMASVKMELIKIYMKYGFWPKDTRLVEPMSILSNKGIEGKEIYLAVKWSKYKHLTGKETEEEEKEDATQVLGIRFDHTVSLARRVYQFNRAINKPYRVYSIGKVYRGERATDAIGRHNEFYQADIDVIGDDDLSFDYDAEMPAIIYEIFRDVFSINKFVIRINNRRLLEGLFMHYQIKDIHKVKKAIKIIDSIEKISHTELLDELRKVDIDEKKAYCLMKLFNLSKVSDPVAFIKALKSCDLKEEVIARGIDELYQVIEGVTKYGVSKQNLRVWLSIARGLEYYDGTVYETFIHGMEHIGSVCSGGRYENLVGSISQNSNNRFPGVGISIGLTRLVPQLHKTGHLKLDCPNPAQILVTTQDNKCKFEYIKIAKMLREEGFRVEEYHQKKIKLKTQLNYANKARYKFVIIANNEEINRKVVIVRNMIEKKQQEVSISNLSDFFNKKLKNKKIIKSTDEEKDSEEENNDFWSEIASMQKTQNLLIDDQSKIKRILNQLLFPYSQSTKPEITVNQFGVMAPLADIAKRIPNNSIAVLWYAGNKKDPVQSHKVYREFIRKMYEKRCKTFLLDISAWRSFHKRGSSLQQENKFIKKMKSEHMDVIHTAHFFEDMLYKIKLTDQSNRYITLLKEICERKDLYKISKKFEGEITLEDIFGQDSPLGKIIDLKKLACKTYSLFQYIELFYIVSDITSKTIQQKDKYDFYFVLPNNEIEYYPVSSLEKDLSAYLCNSEQINLNMYCFKYGNQIWERPYIS